VSRKRQRAAPADFPDIRTASDGSPDPAADLLQE